jgi:hypothetical protein
VGKGFEKTLLRVSLPFENRQMRYDVVGRSGRLEEQLILGPNERLLGFGARSVYLVVTDIDGTQTIQRHPWP